MEHLGFLPMAAPVWDGETSVLLWKDRATLAVCFWERRHCKDENRANDDAVTAWRKKNHDIIIIMLLASWSGKAMELSMLIRDALLDTWATKDNPCNEFFEWTITKISERRSLYDGIITGISSCPNNDKSTNQNQKSNEKNNQNQNQAENRNNKNKKYKNTSCSYCHKKGHQWKDCYTLQADRKNKSIRDGWVDKKMKTTKSKVLGCSAKIILGNTNVTALLSTGTSISAVDDEIIRNMNGTIETIKDCLILYGPDTVIYNRVFITQMKIGNITKNIRLAIIDDLGYDVVLGFDLIVKMHFDLQKKKFGFKKNETVEIKLRSQKLELAIN